MNVDISQLANGVGKAIETVPEVYDDALKPATQESGKLLGRIPRAINAAFAGLDKWILKREYSVEETKKILALELENISPEKIVTPEPYVAIPAIQAISYTMDSSELRNLYAKLLAKAMDEDKKDSVHPAYIETIKQLSPDDAAYFRHIAPLQTRPMVDVKLVLQSGATITLANNCNLFSTNHVTNLALSINNLTRLGLIDVPFGISYGNMNLYEELHNSLTNDFKIENYKNFRADAVSIDFENRRIDITEYGRCFYNTCIA